MGDPDGLPIVFLHGDPEVVVKIAIGICLTLKKLKLFLLIKEEQENLLPKRGLN